jgi:hypothetical protein
VPPTDGVGQQLTLQLGVLAVAEAGGGFLGQLDVEHVQIAAAAAEADDLPVERADQVDVVGL